MIVNSAFSATVLYGFAHMQVTGKPIFGDLIVPLFVALIVGLPLGLISFVVLFYNEHWKHTFWVLVVSIVPAFAAIALMAGSFPPAH